MSNRICEECRQEVGPSHLCLKKRSNFFDDEIAAILEAEVRKGSSGVLYPSLKFPVIPMPAPGKVYSYDREGDDE